MRIPDQVRYTGEEAGQAGVSLMTPVPPRVQKATPDHSTFTYSTP